MTKNHAAKSVAGAIRFLASGDAPNVEIVMRRSLHVQMEYEEIDILDLMYVLKRCPSVESGFAPDCYIVSGATVDGGKVAVAVCPNLTRGRLKLLKTWRV